MFRKFPIYILIFAVSLMAESAYGALSCTVDTTCASPGVVVLRMNSTTNSHAELPTESNYAELLCCSGVADLSNSCSGNFGVVARLSGTTNAHVEENTESTAAYDGDNACLSVSSGTVTIGYQNNDCSTFDAIVASISGTPTNAHIGEPAAYTRKICASIDIGATPSPSPSGGGGGRIFNYMNNGCKIADFNCDGLVNLLDLSIFLYYADQPGPVDNLYDLSQDGRLDLIDISIMFYYWDL